MEQLLNNNRQHHVQLGCVAFFMVSLLAEQITFNIQLQQLEGEPIRRIERLLILLLKTAVFPHFAFPEFTTSVFHLCRFMLRNCYRQQLSSTLIPALNKLIDVRNRKKLSKTNTNYDVVVWLSLFLVVAGYDLRKNERMLL